MNNDNDNPQIYKVFCYLHFCCLHGALEEIYMMKTTTKCNEPTTVKLKF